MITIAWYLLKVIICSGILCGYYFLALRNKVFHRWNRFYLLASVVLALLVPLMKINIFQKPDADKGTVIQMLRTISYGDELVIELNRKGGFHINSENFAESSYLLISAVFFTIFLIALYKIIRLKKRYPETKIDKINFISTDAKGTPFSFFNSIFWNNAIDLHSKPGQQIFNHEIAHVKEKHSYDKIFMNVVLIFFWINPFFGLMRKELHMIHEFIADKEALEDNDLNAFAEMILQTVYPGQNFSITNNFFYSPLKRRLLMLTKNKNPKVSYLSRLLVLPLAAIIFFAFTLKVKTGKNDKMANVDKAMIETINANQKIVTTISMLADTVPDMNYKNKKVTSLEMNQSKVKVTYNDGSKETITKAEAKKRGFTFPPPPPPPAPHYPQTPPPPPNNPNLPKPPTPPTPPDLSVSFLQSNALFVIDGQIASREKVKLLSAGKIKSVNVIKGENATSIYGEKGKDGVIEISTVNKSNTNPDNNMTKFKVSKNSSNPLIFIDGKETSRDTMNHISPNKIQAVSILKDETAIQKYGDKGNNGVIEITTKPYSGNDTIPNNLFTKIENEASFPGGKDAWIKYVTKKIQENQDAFTEKDFGTCVLKFIVKQDGTVSDVEATTMKGTKLAEIALNTVKTGPKWIPATQNGRIVNAYRLQPVTLSSPDKK